MILGSDLDLDAGLLGTEYGARKRSYEDQGMAGRFGRC
jgi:hypothetical protein